MQRPTEVAAELLRALSDEGLTIAALARSESPSPEGLTAERLLTVMYETRLLPSDDGHSLEGHWDEWTEVIVARLRSLPADSETPAERDQWGGVVPADSPFRDRISVVQEPPPDSEAP